jgi:3-oxoacyl-[acyl-carrier protein] reductase
MLKDKVKVTCLCPGLVNTDMTRDDLPFDEEEVIQTKDLVDTVQWVMGLSPGASIPSIRIQCTPLIVARNEASEQ